MRKQQQQQECVVSCLTFYFSVAYTHMDFSLQLKCFAIFLFNFSLQTFYVQKSASYEKHIIYFTTID